MKALSAPQRFLSEVIYYFSQVTYNAEEFSERVALEMLGQTDALLDDILQIIPEAALWVEDWVETCATQRELLDAKLATTRNALTSIEDLIAGPCEPACDKFSGSPESSKISNQIENGSE
jgi:hypothetical protein